MDMDTYCKKMNSTFQYGEIHTILEYLLQEYEHGLYIPIWRGLDAAYIIIMRWIFRFLVNTLILTFLYFIYRKEYD